MPGKNLILICGDDDYLVNLSAKKHVDALVPIEQRDFGLEIIDGNVILEEEVNRAVGACTGSVRTPSFLGGTKVTWFRDVSFLSPGKRREDEDGEEVSSAGASKLVECLKSPLDESQVLILSTKKIAKNSSLYKIFQKTGTVEDFGSGLKPWEQNRAAEERLGVLVKDAGLTMDADAREEFLQRVGSDTRTLVNELEKLSLYTGKGAKITREDVNAITSPGREPVVWELLDAFDARDAKRTMAVLAKLEGQKGIAMMVEAMLEKNIRDLIVLREAVDRKWIVNGNWSRSITPETEVLLNVLPVNPTTMNAWKLRKTLSFVNKFTMMELRVARYLLLTMRERLVTSSLPEMYLLQTTLLRIIGRK